ncbi:hypothetical protein ACI782_23825 [Geodermatophilus sp. SYSU D00703]
MHLSLPAVLLTVVYAAALAVAVTAPGQHTGAALVVLAGLVSRWAVRHRRASRAVGAVDAVLAADAAPAARAA